MNGKAHAPKIKSQRQLLPGYLRSEDLLEALPKTFVETLRECHGLLPLGTGGEGCSLFYDEANLREALFNHARGTVVQPQRKPISLEQVKALRKERIDSKRKSKS